jgi:hypothetical protein
LEGYLFLTTWHPAQIHLPSPDDAYFSRKKQRTITNIAVPRLEALALETLDQHRYYYSHLMTICGNVARKARIDQPIQIVYFRSGDATNESNSFL